MRKIIILLIALLLFVSAQAQSLFFNHIDILDGLSHSTVQSIYQDEYGQMWIGTRNGLNKYDGNTVQRIAIKVDGYNDFFFNEIKEVTGDGKGRIFIISNLRLIIYDTKKDVFYAKEQKDIRTIHYSKDRLWIGTTNRLDYLNDGEDEIKNFIEISPNKIISSILVASDKSVYLGTNLGVEKIRSDGQQENVLDGADVRCIYEDSKNQIWIGSLQCGLFIRKTNGEIENFRNTLNSNNCISSNFIRSIAEDNLGNYWIATYAGLNYFDYQRNKFSNYTHSATDMYSISDFSVHPILKDKQGSLWIGTNFGGVNIVSPEFSFKQYYNSVKGLSGDIVSNVTEDSKGNLWICTDDAGLNYFDRQHNTFKHIKHSSNIASLTSNALKSNLIDEENGCLWIGSNLGGLDRIDLKTHAVKRVALKTGNPNIDNFVRAILKYEDKLILGTHNSVQLFDIKTGKVTPILPEKYQNIRQIWDILLDSSQNLWLSSSNSIYKVNMKTKETVDLQVAIENSPLAVFFEDKDKIIWIGTAGQGLYSYNPKSGKYKYYSTKNSKIIDNYILDIAQSASGGLLITTNLGLSMLEVEKNNFKNYYLNQFFPIKAFNERSLYVTKKGEIVLCSFNGMIIFEEDNLNISPRPYNLNFTNLSINNQPVSPNDDKHILKTSIYETDTLVLQESHSVFSIDVFANNYLQIINPQIKYKLEGFDNKWIDLKSKGSIVYTNLNAKTYTLMVFATDDFSGFVSPIKKLTIIVKPHFYKTWYAYLFYLLLVLGISYIFTSRIFLKNSLKYAKYKAAHIQEVNESKMRFFINVSHEIRTPITLISAQIEYLLNGLRENQSVTGRLLNMKRNSQKLKDLINELLDFRKQELGLVSLNVQDTEIVRYLKNILNTFKEYGQSLKIRSEFTSEVDETLVCFDSVQMDKVFYNLLSNAFKYTPEDGEVQLSFKLEDGNAIITVADTGIGIQPEDTTRIFERYYQVEDNEDNFSPKSPGTGIGLSLVKNIIEIHHGTITVSKNGEKGSLFIINLPLGKNHFVDDENVRFIKQVDENTIKDIKESDKNEVEKLRANVSDSKKHLIYIVEDDEDIRSILIDIFSPLYNVHSFMDAESAYDQIETDMPKLVILDVMLPCMSGIELCAKIKTNLSILHIPVILLTAAAGSEKRIEGLLKGADDYISKPFDVNELIVRCNNLIKNRQNLLVVKDMNAVEKENVQGITNLERAFMSKLEYIIKNNLDNPSLNVDKLAEDMGMARTSLFTKLKEIAATTPNKLILDIRMATALEIIKENKDVFVSEVAYAVGFNTSSYFINLFKAHYGVTPNEFKKSFFNIS